MNWKFIALSSVAATAMAGCASPETKVFQPYTINGKTYQDVVTVGSNGRGSAPVVTQVKTFELGRKRATLVTDASGYEPSLAVTVAGAATGNLTLSVPGAIAYRRQKVTVEQNASQTATTTTTTSDMRLKRDIAAVGKLVNGLILYRFRYLWSNDVFVGVMAQDVRKLMPEAVITDASGYMAVDYALLGISMLRWEQWTLFAQLDAFPRWTEDVTVLARVA